LRSIAETDRGAQLEGEQQDGQHASGAPDGGETPLHWIVKPRYKPEERAYVQNVRAEVHSGHTICARHLLVAGADVNAQSEATGTTALHESVRHGFDEITRLLIYEFGADCGIKDKDGHTPKSLAGKSRLRDLMDRYEESMGISEKPGRKMPSTPPPRGPTAQP
jgi:ankyrin repeat protein